MIELFYGLYLVIGFLIAYALIGEDGPRDLFALSILMWPAVLAVAVIFAMVVAIAILIVAAIEWSVDRLSREERRD